MNTATETLTPQTTMARVLKLFPGAQRALFRRYHIGGCSSCAFQPEETVAQLCQRNGGLDVAEMIAHIQTSHEQDEKMLLTPLELAALRGQRPNLRLLQTPSIFVAADVGSSAARSRSMKRCASRDRFCCRNPRCRKSSASGRARRCS